MYKLSETDVNKLIVACNKMIMSTPDKFVQSEYRHLINRLGIYREQNFPK